MYRLQSMLLLLTLVGLFALLAFALFGWAGAAWVLLLSFAAQGLSHGKAAPLVLAMHRARPLSPWEAPYLFRLAEQLAARAGIPVPRLMVYPAEVPNAFALGAGRGYVALSAGLLRLLDRRQVRGVLAHEMAHLKNRDSLLSLSVGVFVQTIATLSQIWSLTLLLALWLGAGGLGPELWPVLVLSSLAPVGAVLIQAALMRTRERLADRDAAELSGDPRGLALALYRLAEYNRYLRGWWRRFRFIYTAESEEGMGWLRTHPATAERVRALLELEEEMGGQAARPLAPVLLAPA